MKTLLVGTQEDKLAEYIFPDLDIAKAYYHQQFGIVPDSWQPFTLGKGFQAYNDAGIKIFLHEAPFIDSAKLPDNNL